MSLNEILITPDTRTNMTLKKAARDITSLLNKLPKAKTTQEKIYFIFRIKLIVAVIEKQINKRKPDAATTARKRIIRNALKQLLTTLDSIFDKHEEVGDTAVRENMTDAIRFGFIVQKPRYRLPETFGMFTGAGNKRVRSAFQKFLAHPEVVAARKTLKTTEERINAFHDDDAKSREGNSYSEYFGYTNMPKDPSARGLVRRF